LKYFWYEFLPFISGEGALMSADLFCI